MVANINIVRKITVYMNIMKFVWIQYLQPYGTHFTAFTFQHSKSRKNVPYIV